MDRTHIFYAYLATLFALFVVVVVAAILAFYGKYVEALGIGSVFTGLIALAGRFNTTAGNSEQSDRNLATALDKVPPATPGLTPDPPAEQKGE